MLGILWDYNGVIAQDEHLHEAAFREVLTRYGVVLTDQLYGQCCLGRTDAAGFEEFELRFMEQLATVSIEELIAKKQAVYQRCVVPKEILYPGAVEVLRSLNGSPYAIVTSSTRSEVTPVVAYLAGLGVHFSGVITAEDVAKGKPDPEGYLKGLHAIKLLPAQVVVIEDSPSGVEAAKAAGLACIALCHTSTEERLREADLIVPTIRDITLELIRNVLGKNKSAIP